MSNDLATLEPKLEGSVATLARELACWREIATPAQLESAVELLLEAKAAIKKIEAYCDPEIATANNLHKSLIAKKKKLMGELPHEMASLQQIADDYRTAVYQAEQEAERKRVQEAEAEAARVRRIEEEATLQRAAELEASGHERLADIVLKKAEAIAETPIAPVEAVKVEAAKQAGTGRSVKWDYIVKDKELVPRKFMDINRQIVLKDIAVQAFSGKPEIPGLKISECVKTILRG